MGSFEISFPTINSTLSLSRAFFDEHLTVTKMLCGHVVVHFLPSLYRKIRGRPGEGLQSKSVLKIALSIEICRKMYEIWFIDQVCSSRMA